MKYVWMKFAKKRNELTEYEYTGIKQELLILAPILSPPFGGARTVHGSDPPEFGILESGAGSPLLCRLGIFSSLLRSTYTVRTSSTYSVPGTP